MKYSELCPPKRLAVRRDEAARMLSYARIIDEWIASGQLVACNPGDPVPIYSTREIEQLFEEWLVKRRNTPPIRDFESHRQGARDARSAARKRQACPPAN
jgi:hypothetical protein